MHHCPCYYLGNVHSLFYSSGQMLFLHDNCVTCSCNAVLPAVLYQVLQCQFSLCELSMESLLVCIPFCRPFGGPGNAVIVETGIAK